MRVVLDTNVVLSALLFQRGHLAWLRGHWTHGLITPIVDKACADELLRVLTYPKFRLTASEIEVLLGYYLPFTQTVGKTKPRHAKLPSCTDPHDQKFLQLASIGNAKVLITGDRALLALAGQTRFSIETPAQFRRRFDST